jgi:hypothetical protein
MTRNGSIWLLTATLALSGLATPARAQVSESRIRELIKQAADPNSRLQMPATVPAGAQDNRPVIALTLDDAVKFALERNLDIAVQRLNPEINDIAYAEHQVDIPPEPDVAHLDGVDDQRVDQHDIGRRGRRAGDPRPDELQRRACPEHSMGWWQRVNPVEQHQEHDDQFEHAVQPDVSAELVGDVYPTAVSQLLDRLDPPVAEGHQDQPRHLRRAAACHNHQYAVERPQRLLGLCLRSAGGRGRAEVARSSRATSVRDNQTRVEVGTDGAD